MLRTLTDHFRSTFITLWGNKVRSLLTMLGVVIGVFSIITLIGLGEGIKKDVTSEITQLGSNILFVLPGEVRTGGGGFNPAATLGASTLTQEDVAGIKTVPGVVDAAAVGLITGVPTADGNTAQGSMVMATDPSFFDYATIYHLVSGRYFTQEENTNADHVIALGTDAASALFPNMPTGDMIGKTVTVGKDAFTVVGVFEATQTSSLFGGNGPVSPGLVVIPFHTAKTVNENTQIFRIAVKADDHADVNVVAKAVREKLLALHGENDTTVFTQDDLLKVVDNVLSLITKAIVGLASISLIVGGIGIMNIMLVSVTERTKEIGLRKAVGASNRAILTQFLVEAIVLSVVGGGIGVAFSELTSILVKHQANLTILIDLKSVGTALLFSVVIGALFGVAPAIRAARLNPIDALRYE